MIKIKVILILSLLMLFAFFSANVGLFSTSAKTDVLEEIAKYKTWSKITKEPVVVAINNAGLVGS